MFRRFLFAVCGLLLCGAVYGQKPPSTDSLRQVIATAVKKDTVYLDQLRTLIMQLFSTNPQEALEFAQQHLKLADSLKDARRIARSYNLLGNAYKTLGVNGRSIQNYLLALSAYEKLGDKIWVANLHSNLGNAYFNDNRLRDALKEQFTALQLRGEIQNTKGIDGVFGSIGIVYSKMNMPDSAIVYFTRALDTARAQKNVPWIAVYLGNLGNAYGWKKDYQNCKAINMQALALHRKLGDQVSEARTLHNIGMTLPHENKPDSAIWYEKEAYYLAERLGVMPVMQPAAEKLMKLYDSLGNATDALLWARINISLKDTIAAQQVKDEVQEAELNYRLEKEEREAQFKKESDDIRRDADLRRQKILNLSLIAGLLMMAGLATVLFIMFRQKRRSGRFLEAKVRQRTLELSQSNEQLTGVVREKEKAQGELRAFIYKSSHDLKGPLSSIKGLIQAAHLQPDHGSWIPMISHKVERLDGVLQQLIDRAELEQHQLDLQITTPETLLQDIVALLRTREGADRCSFSLKTDFAGDLQTDVFLLRLCLKQIIQNAIDFSDRQRHNQIDILISGNPQRWTIRVQDTGTGMTEEILSKAGSLFFRGTAESKGAGLGLYLAKEAASRLGCGLDIRSKAGEGTEVKLSYA